MSASRAKTYNASEQPRLGYKLTFYVGSLAFAIVTYLFGNWAYRLEAASWVDARSSLTLHEVLESVLPMHLFTFIAWCVWCLALAMLLGYLFDREVRFRCSAEEKANIDGLTELYNHRYFQDRIYTEIERARRYERPLSLIMLDVDDFKAFNDRHGHQEGDRLLSWFGQTCASALREIDVCARYGGEEFAVILPETPLQEAMSVAQRILEAVREGSKSKFAQQATVSAGVASFPEHGQARHTLILSADVALYFAKHSGKDKACAYQASLTKIYRTTPERLSVLLSEDDIGAIEALSAAVDAKDHTQSSHSESVTRYALGLADRLGLPQNDLESLRAAALLHDIGKLGMPDKVLRKKGPLQLDEWRHIENHPKMGSQILERVQQLNSIVPTVRHHHERFDGHGYPSGLSGKDIPLMARIIAIADAFDAMISDRSYRNALDPERALEEIKRCAGTQFDPELVEAFVMMVQEQLERHRKDYGEEEKEAA